MQKQLTRAILFAVFYGVVGALTGSVYAQEPVTSASAARYPASGLAIIDCAPEGPVPYDSCIVRMPPKHVRIGSIQFDNAAGPDAAFEFLSGDDKKFPENLVASATAIVIDTTTGPDSARREQWRTERGYILEFINTLPDGGLVAVYEMDDKLTELVGLTSQKSRAISAVEDLEIDGINTSLASNIIEVIESLGERDDILLKNVVVISDGEEESTVLSVSDLAEVAVAQGVTVSTMATIWRKRGGGDLNATKRGAGIGFMKEMTRKTLGSHAVVEIYNSTVGAEAATTFASDFANSISQSGLIVPSARPVSADIILHYGEPIAGRPGEYDKKTATVSFVASTSVEPVVVSDVPAATKDAGFAGFPWGFPEHYVYIAAAILALLLFILFALVLGRRSSESEDEIEDNESEDVVGTGQGTEAIDAPAPAPKPRTPWAYFIRSDTGERLPVYDRRAKIGRSSENEVSFNEEDGKVSRFHANLEVVAGKDIFLTDSNSVNGTFVNGKQANSSVALKSGDLVTFGDKETKFIIR